MSEGAEVIVIGAGARGVGGDGGIGDAGRRVTLIEQEPGPGCAASLLVVGRPLFVNSRSSAGSGFATRTSGRCGTGW